MKHAGETKTLFIKINVWLCVSIILIYPPDSGHRGLNKASSLFMVREMDLNSFENIRVMCRQKCVSRIKTPRVM